MKGPVAIFVLDLATGASAAQCPTEHDNWDADLLLPHLDCAKFNKCNNGKPVGQACPSGLLYNFESKQCDWSENVRCRDSTKQDKLGRSKRPEDPQRPERPEKSEQSEGSEKSEEAQIAELEEARSEPSVKVIEFLPNGCPANRNIHWLLPSRWFCRWFYYCVNGHRELRSCAKGLHFNPELQVCDWPETSGCFNLLVLEA